MYAWLADLVVLIHFVFILFVILGGVLVWRWRRVAWLHVPAAVWGALIIQFGWLCPLTPLENWLRSQAGETGYAGGFISHYLLPLIYPGGLTPELRLILALLTVAINLLIYGLIWRRRR